MKYDYGPSEREQFVEDAGLFFEQGGLPRMSGRIIGWLLIANPPYQSAEQLAEGLQASKGSISTMTRLLIQFRLIERVAIPGERRDYFAINGNAWLTLFEHRIQSLSTFRRLAERGLRLVENEPPEVRHNLEEIGDLYSWLEGEMRDVMQRWHRHLEERRRQRS